MTAQLFANPDLPVVGPLDAQPLTGLFFTQGLDASLIGVIPYAAFRLGLYDGFKWLHKRVRNSMSLAFRPFNWHEKGQMGVHFSSTGGSVMKAS